MKEAVHSEKVPLLVGDEEEGIDSQEGQLQIKQLELGAAGGQVIPPSNANDLLDFEVDPATKPASNTATI